MERDESLINGPGVQPPVSVSAPVPRDVTGDALRQGVAQIGQNAGGVFREMVETEDSTKQFEQERILMQMQDEVNLEAKRRLQLPDGDPEAFFDERGNFSQVAVKDFLNPYKKTLAGIGSGIMVPERARKMQMKAALMGDKMLGDLMDSGFEVARQKQEQSFKDCYDLAVEQGNYSKATELIAEGVKNGLFSSQRGEVMRLKMSRSLARRAAAQARDTVLTARKMTDHLLNSLMDKPQDAENIQKQAVRNPGNSMGLSLVDEFNKSSAETSMDMFGLPEEVKEGLSSLSPDQFEEEWTLTNMAANQATAQKEPNTGKFLYSVPSGAPEAIQAYCHQASVNGGFTKDNVKRMIYAVAAHLESHPDYAGLPDSELRKAIIGRVTIKGLEDDLFSDAEFPDVAAQAFTEGIVDNVLVSRKSEVDKRVNDAFKKWEEMGPTHADIAAQFKDDDAYRDAANTFFGGWNDAAGALNGKEYARYKNQFLMEEGLKETGTIPINAFRGWFFKKDGIHDQRVKSFVESVKDFYKAKATDAVAEYRKKGGKSWSEEQQIIQDVLKTPLESVVSNVRGDWRERRQGVLREKAESYRQEAKRWLPALTAAQEKGAAREKAREEEVENAEDRANEPKKWQQEREKAQRKKEWTEVQERADAAKYPYKYKVNALVGYRNDGDEDPVMTVPAQEYARMLSELEAGDNEGIVVKVGNGRNEYAVRPGNVEGMNMNAAMIRAVYGTRRLSKSQLKKLINGHKTILKFNKF